jgi:DNA-binding transcriptional LysR family regulator
MLMTVEIDQVQAFVAIVRGGGFTRAASILHLSQPAVSRRLNLLERELGAPLFERIRSGVILTEAGRTFLPHAEGLLACMRDGLDSVRALHQVDRGTITLALVGTLASTTLTACLERFRDAHPRVELRLRTALSQEVSVLVRRGDTTLGLRYGGDPHAEILATPIYDEPMMVVCSPRHRLARRRSVAPSALGAERWVAFPPRGDAFYDPYPWSLQNRLAAWGLSPAEIIPIDSLTAQKRMVEAGFGLALLPESSVDEELRTGTLRSMRISGTRVTIPVVLIHRRRAYLSGAARALMAELTAWPSRQTSPRGPHGSGRGLARAARRTGGSRARS